MSLPDSQMLWTDIVIKFALLVRNGTYKHQDKMLGYIKNLANYMALNFFRDAKKKYNFEEFDEHIKDPAIESATLYHKELKQMMDRELMKLGETCKELLLLWANGYSMAEIQSKMTFVSGEATRKRKHICMKKLLANVRSDTDLIGVLKEYYNLTQ